MDIHKPWPPPKWQGRRKLAETPGRRRNAGMVPRQQVSVVDQVAE